MDTNVLIVKYIPQSIIIQCNQLKNQSTESNGGDEVFKYHKTTNTILLAKLGLRKRYLHSKYGEDRLKTVRLKERTQLVCPTRCPP